MSADEPPPATQPTTHVRRRAERYGARERTALDGVVAQRLSALDEVIVAADGRLAPELLEPARALAHRAGKRLRMAGSHTVVALAGSTGSGKSSTFNALAGRELSPAGIRRPTTSVAHAVIWGDGGAGPLLDWLQVPRRQYLNVLRPDVAEPMLDGLVLLDMPDHDSTEHGHRMVVDRLVDLVDMLVWVLDPQKYADGAVHERYLRPLAGHAKVMVVVLNQADLLPPDQVEDTLEDLRKLLVADGLGPIPVLATSTVAPGGLDGLRELLVEAVAARVVTLQRLAADLDDIWAGLSGTVAGPVSDAVDQSTVAELTAALAEASGVPEVSGATRTAYRDRAVAATRLALPQRFRPSSARPPAPGIGGRAQVDLARVDLAQADLAQADLAQADLAQVDLAQVDLAQVDLALSEMADRAAAGLPDPWPVAVRSAARARASELGAALDQAIAATDLGLPRGTGAWRAIGVVLAGLGVAAVLAALWLVVSILPGLAGMDSDWAAPTAGPVSLPVALLLGSVGAALLVLLASRLMAARLARRAAERAEARLRLTISDLAEDLAIIPVRAELAAYGRLLTALNRLRNPT